MRLHFAASLILNKASHVASFAVPFHFPGYTFQLVNYVYDNSDDSLFDTCTVSVQTTRTTSSAYALAGVGALATFLVAAYVSKRRRSATIDLVKEETLAQQTSDFVEMTDKGVAV